MVFSLKKCLRSLVAGGFVKGIVLIVSALVPFNVVSAQVFFGYVPSESAFGDVPKDRNCSNFLLMPELQSSVSQICSLGDDADRALKELATNLPVSWETMPENWTAIIRQMPWYRDGDPKGAITLLIAAGKMVKYNKNTPLRDSLAALEMARLDLRNEIALPAIATTPVQEIRTVAAAAARSGDYDTSLKILAEAQKELKRGADAARDEALLLHDIAVIYRAKMQFLMSADYDYQALLLWSLVGEAADDRALSIIADLGEVYRSKRYPDRIASLRLVQQMLSLAADGPALGAMVRARAHSLAGEAYGSVGLRERHAPYLKAARDQFQLAAADSREVGDLEATADNLFAAGSAAVEEARLSSEAALFNTGAEFFGDAVALTTKASKRVNLLRKRAEARSNYGIATKDVLVLRAAQREWIALLDDGSIARDDDFMLSFLGQTEETLGRETQDVGMLRSAVERFRLLSNLWKDREVSVLASALALHARALSAVVSMNGNEEDKAEVRSLLEKLIKVDPGYKKFAENIRNSL